MPGSKPGAPINTIREDSGNVQCLEVLRVMQREPAAVEAFPGEVGAAQGRYPRFFGNTYGMLPRGSTARR